MLNSDCNVHLVRVCTDGVFNLQNSPKHLEVQAFSKGRCDVDRSARAGSGEIHQKCHLLSSALFLVVAPHVPVRQHCTHTQHQHLAHWSPHHPFERCIPVDVDVMCAHGLSKKPLNLSSSRSIVANWRPPSSGGGPSGMARSEAGRSTKHK